MQIIQPLLEIEQKKSVIIFSFLDKLEVKACNMLAKETNLHE